MRLDEVTITAEGGVTMTLFEKRLSPRERTEPEAVRRLRGEADLLAALGGRMTPRLVGTGDDERGPWLRTEKIPFPTLAQRLDAAGDVAALDPAWIERALAAALAALSALHEAVDAQGPLSIVHADLSPANVALDDTGARAVFLDLELASWRGSPPRDGAFRGTLAYCAPETARGEPPTVASDLFALAATFLHAVTGAAPRSGPSFAALLAAAAERPLLDDHPLVASGELAARGPAHAALARCLAHEPGRRPASARDALALVALVR
jgi:serine/threonine protein kinase